MLTDVRESPRPILYPQAEKYWDLQVHSRWSHKDVKTQDDLMDWQYKMQEPHKQAVCRTLGLFSIVESYVGNQWAVMANWFPNVEMQGACYQAAAGETVHIRAYLNTIDSLNIGDQVIADVSHIKPLRDKIDYLVGAAKTENWHDRMLSIAVFSAFTEGVNLFSTFALLIYFSRKGMMKGIKRTIEWSARDESLHSEFGCWIFNTMARENPSLRTPELEAAVIEAAHTAVALEDAYLDFVFGDQDSIFELTKADLKQYTRHRADCKLADIGYRPIFNVGPSLRWIDRMLAGEQNTDNFDGKPSEYTSGMNVEDAW